MHDARAHTPRADIQWGYSLQLTCFKCVHLNLMLLPRRISTNLVKCPLMKSLMWLLLVMVPGLS